jgi:hypothetical protein
VIAYESISDEVVAEFVVACVGGERAKTQLQRKDDLKRQI